MSNLSPDNQEKQKLRKQGDRRHLLIRWGHITRQVRELPPFFVAIELEREIPGG